MASFILSVLLSISCSSAAGDTVSPLVGSNGPLDGQQAAECRLIIIGRKDGRLHQASMNCTGGTKPTIALDTIHLRGFLWNFTGVKLTDSCPSEVTQNTSCLVTICSESLVLRESLVAWVRNIPLPLKVLVCVVHDSRLEVYDSRFTNNMVRPLMIGDQASMVLHASNVSYNTIHRVADGGGMWVEGSARVTVTGGSRVHGNAVGGYSGGVFVRENASVVIAGGSIISNNTAADNGGGLSAWDNASVSLTGGSSIHSNVAVNGSGGGVDVRNGAQVAILDGIVHGNTARGGGGVWVGENASVVIAGGSSIISNNTAHSGGGLGILGSANVTITGGSSIHSNVAVTGSGGGVAVGGGAKVTITNSSVHGNTAQRDGGGLFAQDASKVAITNSSIGNNTAADLGGGLSAWDNASVSLTGGSSIHSNVAVNGSGGGVFVGNGAKVAIINSNIHGNIAGRYAGGVVAAGFSRVTISNAALYGNSAYAAGGGMFATGSSTLLLANSSRIHNNRALNGSGGGLFVTRGTLTAISGGCSIADNSCTGGVGGGISVGMDEDGLQFGSMGRLEGASAALGRKEFNTSVIISGSIIANNTSHHGAGGGVAAVSQSVVRLVNGTKVVGNRANNSSGGAVMVMGNAHFQADGTVVFANNGVPRGYVGSTVVAFENSNLSLPIRGQLTKCNTSVYLGRTPCGQGEVMQHDVCVCCPPHTYGFGNGSCTQCPNNAACPGASIVEPLPGFWSSSPMSIQMHRCPLFKTACDFVNQTHMCKPGYQGPLCGECLLPDYGMLSPMRCGKCMRPATQLGLYLFFSFMTVVFVDLTVHFTWQDNIKGNRVVCITDYIKVLVLFLQYIVIIGGVSVPWPLFDVQIWLQAIGIMVTMGSGQAMSLDCWLHSYNPHSKLPIALQRQLVYFLAPVFTFLAVLALQCLVWAVRCWVVPLIWKPKEGPSVPRPFLLRRKLPVTVLVLVFYAYPTLVRASFSFFACLAIDKPLSALSDVPAGATAPLSHRWGY